MKYKTLILLLIIMISILSPITNTTTTLSKNLNLSDTAGRAVEPDINISSLDWIGSSYLNAGTPILAETTQSVRVTISNDGLALASGILSFYVNNGNGSGFVLIDSQPISMVPGTINQYIFNWVATQGATQQARIYATVPGDSDNLNNQLIENFLITYIS